MTMKWVQRVVMAKLCLPLGGLLALAMLANSSHAQYTPYVWNGGPGAAKDWHSAGNWSLATVPNDTSGVATVSAAGNLSVTLGTTPASLGGLVIGGTATATTDVGGSGTGILTFQSDVTTPFTEWADFNNTRLVDGTDFLIWQRNLNSGSARNQGDANNDFTVNELDLAILKAQYGKLLVGEGVPYIVSQGAAGSVNTISAPIQLNDARLEIDAGTVPLTIQTGDITTNSNGRAILAMRGQVTINSNIVVTGDTGALGLNSIAPSAGDLIINGTIRSVDPALPNIAVNFGGAPNTPATSSRIFLNGPSELTGGVNVHQRIVLGHNNALGVDPLNPTTRARVNVQGGTNISAANSTIAVANTFRNVGSSTYSGSNTFTHTGIFTASNPVTITNSITSPAELVLNNDLRVYERDAHLTGPQQINTYDLNRSMTFAGTGTTRIIGKVGSSNDGGNTLPRDPIVVPGGQGRMRTINQSGGILIFDTEPNDNDHRGPFRVTGAAANAHFANDGSLNLGTFSVDADWDTGLAAPIVKPLGDKQNLIFASTGAVGMDSGSLASTEFLTRIDPTSDGGFMLAASEASANVNFNNLFTLAPDNVTVMGDARNMSLAGPETGMTYTGTITPNGDYRLGGGRGTLTLPNLNQITGASNLVVKNGGTVVLSAANNYTGTTRVEAGTILSIMTAAFDLHDTSNVLLEATGTLNLNFAGTDTIGALSFDGGTTFQSTGVYGAVGSGAPFTSALITGTGRLNVTAIAFSAVPEPCSLAMFGLAAMGLVRRRRKSA